ncbi:7TM-DISM domain-containing protein [Simplicispira psychrophila]|uniref:sensor histidine kinase n=1 Tax=Simplicispira psychrophila TaxID=80882 RepID=UPI00247FCDC0|nr:7TM-DISM domain-containing protein [Simplicispira psychrophila]
MNALLLQLLRLLRLCLLAGLVTAASAGEADHIISRDFLPDPGGHLAIEQASMARFQPVGPILSQGYTDAAYWLRLVVRPREDGGKLVLRIRPTFLDEVTLYEADPAPSGGWQSRVTGDRAPFLARELASVTLGFEVQPVQPHSVYYLRLKTTSSSILNVEALEPTQAWLRDSRLSLFQALYLGVMMWLLFWAISDYVASRQRVMGWFSLRQGGFIFFHLATMGSLAPLVPADTTGLVDQLTSFSVCMISLVEAMFHRVLLASFAPPRLIMRGLDALIVVLCAALGLLASGYTGLALQINAWVVLLVVPLFVVLALSARHEAPPGRRILRVIYTLQAAMLLVGQLPLLGWVDATEWSLNATRAYGFIVAVLMFALLHRRSRQLQREGMQAVLNLAVTQQQLQMAQTQRETQHRFMAMLSHELKTPMSVIRMALGMSEINASIKHHAQQSVADMDAVVERCLQVDQLEQHLFALRRTPCRMGSLLAELCAASAAPQRIVIAVQELPAVNTDPQLLHIALNNLIDNALKYAALHSPIHMGAVRSEQQGQCGVLVSIANTPGSAGMPDPLQVFEKYYRSPDAYAKTGSGLGLYLVRGMAEQLGGWVCYTPSHNEVRFELWLPC